ncbi:hypothetical protein SFUMM280S_09007 [Streptomyces fumanus]
MYSVLPGSNRSRNHRRCWAYDSGAGVCGAVAGIASAGVAEVWPTGSPSSAASADTVLWVNSTRGDTSGPNAARSRAVTRTARMESPPSAKKSSPADTSSTPRTSDQAAATARSAGVRGAVRSVSAA